MQGNKSEILARISILHAIGSPEKGFKKVAIVVGSEESARKIREIVKSITNGPWPIGLKIEVLEDN